MRKKMKTLSALLFLGLLSGCHAHTNHPALTTSVSKDEVIASLNKPTNVSELTQHKLEGKLIYYIGTSLQKPTLLTGDRFDKIKTDMTIEQLVDTLGPGFSRNDVGLAFISWQCDDGRTLHVFININSLKQVPQIHKFKNEKDS